jgi:hypothetical protein
MPDRTCCDLSSAGTPSRLAPPRNLRIEHRLSVDGTGGDRLESHRSRHVQTEPGFL